MARIFSNLWWAIFASVCGLARRLGGGQHFRVRRILKPVTEALGIRRGASRRKRRRRRRGDGRHGARDRHCRGGRSHGVYVGRYFIRHEGLRQDLRDDVRRVLDCKIAISVGRFIARAMFDRYYSYRPAFMLFEALLRATRVLLAPLGAYPYPARRACQSKTRRIPKLYVAAAFDPM